MEIQEIVGKNSDRIERPAKDVTSSTYLPFDELEYAFLSSQEVLVVKLHLILVCLQSRVFNGSRLPKAIHVQLTNETCHVVVLEVQRKQFPRKACLVMNDERLAILRPGDQTVVL